MAVILIQKRALVDPAVPAEERERRQINLEVGPCLSPGEDKRKAFTWLAALLSFYPQYIAC